MTTMTNPYSLKLTVKFSTRTERDERVLKVAESFGIGLEDREFVVFDGLELDINAGDVVYINGQSGSGKSCALREISRLLGEAGLKVQSIEDVELLDKPVISQIGRTMEEATQLLALAGLSDAYLYVRKPSELSDGQRYRFRLAKLLESDADVWVADEFMAIMDRTTAKVISSNLQKIARKMGKTVIVATTHTDLVDELAPDLIIYKRFQDRVDLKRAA